MPTPTTTPTTPRGYRPRHPGEHVADYRRALWIAFREDLREGYVSVWLPEERESALEYVRQLEDRIARLQEAPR